MLDVHVVTAANAALYGAQLDLCYRWRHRIYVDEKRWMPPQADGREIDQFDDGDATYLLAYRDNLFVAASRLRPFSAPTLLGEVFSGLAGVRGVPERAEEAEWTRMFVVPGLREKGHKGVAAAMCCAVMEYCLDEGLDWVGGIQETYWLPRWMDYGWEVMPLGLPQDIDGTSCLAALFKVSPEALEGVRAAAGVAGSQVVRLGPRRDFRTGRVHRMPALSSTAANTIENLQSVLS